MTNLQIEVINLANEGLTCAEICRKLNRAVSTVSGILITYNTNGIAVIIKVINKFQGRWASVSNNESFKIYFISRSNVTIMGYI